MAFDGLVDGHQRLALRRRDVAETLSVIVPAVGPSLLAEKLADLRKIEGWVSEIVVCFNGPNESLADVEAIVAAAQPRVVLSVSDPFDKSTAIRVGLGR